MGYAIADAAAARGHAVTLVSGPVGLTAPKNARLIDVTTAGEMASAAKKAFTRADAAIFTAAVCDYRPHRRAPRKVSKKSASRRVLLVPTEDIAAALGAVKGRRITIGFAMEDYAARRHAERKLARKRCDAIVLNGPQNVGSERAEVEFLRAGGTWERWPSGSKRQIARRLIVRLERMAAGTF